MQKTFHNQLEELISDFTHKVYYLSKSFPKEELYGLTSQLRRSALSVCLNYIEGYARKKPLVMINFLEISYGSLKEARFLIKFCNEEGFINNNDSAELISKADRIGSMIWSTIKGIQNKQD